MNTLESVAVTDQCREICKEAMRKYELANHCLDNAEWESAFGYFEKGDDLMNLANRLQIRAVNNGVIPIAELFTEREQLNRGAGLSS